MVRSLNTRVNTIKCLSLCLIFSSSHCKCFCDQFYHLLDFVQSICLSCVVQINYKTPGEVNFDI